MFEDPAPLRFRTLDILRTLAKDILDDLSREEANIQQNTGAGLIIKAFGGGADSPLPGTTKTAKKIKVANACERCRKRKTGCDGYLPCGTCFRQHQECRYAPGVSAPLRPATASPPPNSVPPPTPPDLSARTQQQPFRVDRFSATAAAVTNSPTTATKPVPSPVPAPAVAPATPATTLSTSAASPPCPSHHCMSVDPAGHFIGETSFYVSSTSNVPPALPAAPSVFPPLEIPNLSTETQDALVETYCTHVNPFFPSVVGKARMLLELDRCRAGRPSVLSPLFFYALFARATAVATTTNHALTSDIALSQQLLNLALRSREAYYDKPHFSTVLALVIMANQLEHSKLEQHLTRAWLLVGEAVRLAIDMGLHRAFCICNGDRRHLEAQWCVRTFWSLVVTERIMSMTYGRPSILDEKDIDIPLPEPIAAVDDDRTSECIKSLRYMTVMSNIAGKISRYNYSVQTQLPGAFKTNATMSTVDTWLSSECHPLREYLANTRGQQMTRSQLNGLEALYFMHNLIQAHRPFVNQDRATKAPFARPSFEICFLTAIIISYMVYTVPHAEFVQLSMSPPTLHVVVMALHIHLANASSPESDRRTTIFSEISFDRTVARLEALPVVASNSQQISMLSSTLSYLKSRYHQRSQSIVSGYASTPQQQRADTAATTPFHHTTTMAPAAATVPADPAAQAPFVPSTTGVEPSSQPFTFIAFHSDGSHRRVSSSTSSSRRRQQRQQQQQQQKQQQHATMSQAPVTTPSSPGYALLEIPTPSLPSSTLDMYNSQTDYFFAAPEGDPDLPSSILSNNEFHYF